MRPRLIVQLTGHSDPPLAWRGVDAQGVPEDPGTRDQPAARDRRVFALVPGTEVLTTRARIPARSRQRILQAVPWVLEDQLSEDVHLLHFAIGERDNSGMVPVAVVARDALERWQTTLEEAGLSAEQLYPDYLALPRQSDTWTLLVTDGIARVRTGQCAGFACDADMLPLFLEAALAEAAEDAPSRLIAYLGADAPLLLPQASPEPERHTIDDPLALLADHLEPRHAIGLRPDSDGNSEQLGRWWRTWRIAVMLLIAVALLDTGHAWLQRWQLEAATEQQREAMTAVFRKAFPEAGTPIYPRRQMESRVATLRGGDNANTGGMLPLLARLTPALANQAIRLTGLAYRGGSLELQVMAPDLQALDALKQRLTGEGVGTRVSSARNTEGGVVGRLTVEGGA